MSTDESMISDHNVWNRNPEGRNQYPDCPSKGDANVEDILREYHRRKITNAETIRKLLFEEHGITMSAVTIKRRKQQFGLKGSGATTRELPSSEKRQLVLDQMAKDPTRQHGPRRIQELIALETSVHLTRDYIREEMSHQDPEGFELRNPQAKKKHRVPSVALGPHCEWSCNGHAKLSGIGFPICGIRDVWSAKWLLLRVVPNNRLKYAITYLWLSLVKELGGMPLQTTTDRGKETTTMYGLANALREATRPDLPVDEVPADRFLRSIENTPIERGWRQLRLEWGDDVKVFWEAGQHLYNRGDDDETLLVQLLWSSLIQRELDKLQYSLNNHRVRKDRNKILPSGTTPNIAMSLYKTYDADAENHLQVVDLTVIESLMQAVGGEDLVRFVPLDYEHRASQVLADLGMSLNDVVFENVWDVFTRMLPLM